MLVRVFVKICLEFFKLVYVYKFVGIILKTLKEDIKKYQKSNYSSPLLYQ